MGEKDSAGSEGPTRLKNSAAHQDGQLYELHGKPGLHRIVQKDKNGPGGTTRYRWMKAQRKVVEREQGA